MNLIQKIKLFFVFKKAKTEVENMALKSGIKSTEFWLTVLTQVSVIASGLSGILDPKIATILTVVGTSLYTIMRTLAKEPEITTLVNNNTINNHAQPVQGQ